MDDIRVMFQIGMRQRGDAGLSRRFRAEAGRVPERMSPAGLGLADQRDDRSTDRDVRPILFRADGLPLEVRPEVAQLVRLVKYRCG